METLTAFDPIEVAPDTVIFPAFMALPGLGVLPMHAYLIRAARPMLVDAGPGPLADGFVTRLSKVMDPADLEFVFLTHADPDHTGALTPVLDAAPQARVATSFLGAGKLGLSLGVPPARTYLLNPGQALDLGDRHVHAVRPPVFDAPESVMAFDARTRALFTADAFGTLMPAAYSDAAALTPAARREGMLTWAGVDAPWLADFPRTAMDRALARVARLAPDWVLGAHLPPARGALLESLILDLADAPGLTPFVGPDQAAVEAATEAA